MGRPDGKNLQILDLHRLASLELIPQNTKYLTLKHSEGSV